MNKAKAMSTSLHLGVECEGGTPLTNSWMPPCMRGMSEDLPGMLGMPDLWQC